MRSRDRGDEAAGTRASAGEVVNLSSSGGARPNLNQTCGTTQSIAKRRGVPLPTVQTDTRTKHPILPRSTVTAEGESVVCKFESKSASFSLDIGREGTHACATGQTWADGCGGDPFQYHGSGEGEDAVSSCLTATARTRKRTFFPAPVSPRASRRLWTGSQIQLMRASRRIALCEGSTRMTSKYL